MKRTTKNLIITAAIAGLLSGAGANVGVAASGNDAKPGYLAEGKQTPKPHDCAGKNDCKGLGGCKSAKNDCKFKNDCKGQGACKVTKEDIEKHFGKKKK